MLDTRRGDGRAEGEEKGGGVDGGGRGAGDKGRTVEEQDTWMEGREKNEHLRQGEKQGGRGAGEGRKGCWRQGEDSGSTGKAVRHRR